MKNYLIAADADKIQDFLFRSARLRQISGGSQMLIQFEETIRELLKHHNQSDPNAAIVNNGGNLRVYFDELQEANSFKINLAEAYRRHTGASLTVVGPESYDPGTPSGFTSANRKLRLQLLEAKQKEVGEIDSEHVGIMALCASCGQALAELHATLPGEESSQARYLCQPCFDKADSRQRQAFYRQLTDRLDRNFDTFSASAGDATDEVAQLDSKGYVAYLLADGNGMGELFSGCNSEPELTRLSDKLQDSMWRSLAQTLDLFLAQVEINDDLARRMKKGNNQNEEILPIVPLIIGGDDLLALIPAQYALDIAREFCESFQTLMSQPGKRITIAASVVICKSNYPYKLAYERAHHGLEHTKEVVKQLAEDGGPTLSGVTFEIITGNAIRPRNLEATNYRSSMKPYWILPQEDRGQLIDVQVEKAQLSGEYLTTLLAQRVALRNLPKKRLNELRRLFDDEYLENAVRLANKTEKGALWEWIEEMNFLFGRIQRIQSHWEALREAMHALGERPKRGALSMADSSWRSMVRAGEGYFAHGLPDLIEAWDYAYQLHRDPEEYATERV